MTAMPSSIEPFEVYLHSLAALGHDRHWLRRNAPVLRQRFAIDPQPFHPLPEPPEPARDRYEGL